MKLDKEFIPLPFFFDADALMREITQLPVSAWQPHPLGLKGNSAVALISQKGGMNDDFGGQMKLTAALEACPYHQQVMACFGEVLARSRLMKLEPGCEVSSHVDFNYHWHTRVRIHIPVVTTPEVIFFCDSSSMHMQAGECWIFDSWRRHKVVNASRHERIHLVIDLAGSSRFWRIVRQMQELDAENDKTRIEQLTRYIPFEPGLAVDIRTENYNISPVMAPGEVDGLVHGVISEFENCAGNAPDLVRHYKYLLNDFAKDWREIWNIHGIQKSGIPHYAGLVEKSSKLLNPDRRALVTSDNDIGVNPVIMQRIFRAVLALEFYDAFIDGAE